VRRLEGEFEDVLAKRRGWRRLDDYPFPQNLQIRHRWEILRTIMAKTDRINVCEIEEPMDADWLDAARVQFTYRGPLFYTLDEDRNTVSEGREGWTTLFDGDGAILETSRIGSGGHEGTYVLYDALRCGPTPQPERN